MHNNWEISWELLVDREISLFFEFLGSWSWVADFVEVDSLGVFSIFSFKETEKTRFISIIVNWDSSKSTTMSF